ncbi:sensor histidine kinase [Halolamina salifodinae]|uniref:histidine kinase n=1 Tax=Halolamina salifodinae TaxID=1202767 RepID=A0A8T4GWS4_9EURY|nr:HAMP domain-containing sensor histidine kinase [Halolamina salifodinae]MBP1987376.1 signal transduction histidine kinase [Halolamina salifodinae]
MDDDVESLAVVTGDGGEPVDNPGLRRRLAAGAISTVGLVLLGVPAYDIWDDASNLGWGIADTLLENSVLIGLALLLIGGGVWLFGQDWSDDDVVLAARWTVGGALATAGLYAVVILLQLQVMGRLKPYVLAADGVLMGSVAAFGAGLYDVQRRQSRRELTAERDRFRAFFEGTNVPIVTVGHRDDGLVAGEGNPAYEDAFAVGFEALLATAKPTSESDFDREQFVHATLRAEPYRDEIHVPPENLDPSARADDEDDRLTKGRFYDVRTVHVAADETFVVFTEITAGKERERLLAERTERLARQKSERERELEERTNQLEFLHSLLRHDVQNGTMVIGSRAEILREELSGREAEFATTILTRARGISDQIDRIRTALNTLTEGTTTEPVDLSELLERRVETFRDNYPDVHVETDIDAGLRAEADDILDDVLANLLRNAVEHNDKEQVEIEVVATEVDDGIRIGIADNGPGVPEEDRDQVFRRGVSNAQAGGPSGSGFGLFFIDTIVDGYGGEVHIEDNHPEGARFVVSLPPSDASFGGE